MNFVFFSLKDNSVFVLFYPIFPFRFVDHRKGRDGGGLGKEERSVYVMIWVI